jgi:hypothetical protein
MYNRARAQWNGRPKQTDKSSMRPSSPGSDRVAQIWNPDQYQWWLVGARDVPHSANRYLSLSYPGPSYLLGLDGRQVPNTGLVMALHLCCHRPMLKLSKSVGLCALQSLDRRWFGYYRKARNKQRHKASSDDLDVFLCLWLIHRPPRYVDGGWSGTTHAVNPGRPMIKSRPARSTKVRLCMIFLCAGIIAFLSVLVSHRHPLGKWHG